MRRDLSIYLDLIRFLAATLVVVGHANSFGIPLHKYLAGHGPAAVSAFFLLSGFVISYVTASKEKSAKEYTIARFARIYSVAIPVVLVTLVADKIGRTASSQMYDGQSWYNPYTGFSDIIRYLTFTNETWNSHIIVGTNEPFWSLGFEVWYYIVFGAFLYFPGPKHIRLVLVGVLIIIAGPKIACYFPIWILGVLCQRRVTAWETEKRSTKPMDTVVWTCIFVLTPVAYLIARRAWASEVKPMFEAVHFNVSTLKTILYFNFVGALCALNIVAFYKLARAQYLIGRLLERFASPIRWLAGATFTTYLAHQPILLALISVMPGEKGSSARNCAIMGLTFGVVFLLAEASERRKKLWKRLFERLSGSH